MLQIVSTDFTPLTTCELIICCIQTYISRLLLYTLELSPLSTNHKHQHFITKIIAFEKCLRQQHNSVFDFHNKLNYININQKDLITI